MIALQTTPLNAQNLSTRNWLLDSLRSFAILLMVYYHLLYDLEVLYGIPTGIFHGHWPMVRILGAALFIFLAGYSITLSRNPIRNGCKVLLFACLISIGTLLSFPDDFVRFGILHLLGIGMLISPFFKLPRFNILIGIALFFLGFLPLNYPAWVLPIAGGEQHFSMMDYYPLIPWLSYFFLGLASGQRKYFASYDQPVTNSMLKLLLLPGRYSLIVYLVHQLVILAILILILGSPR